MIAGNGGGAPGRAPHRVNATTKQPSTPRTISTIGRPAEPDAPLFDAHAGSYGQVSFTTAPDRDGNRLRDQGLRRATEGDPGWLPLAEDAIAQLARSGAEFSAEDVRGLAGDPPSEALLGAAFRRARLRGLIEPAGVTTASRAVAHARLLRTWRGRSGGAR